MKSRIGLLLICLVSAVVGKPQISFGEEEEAQPSNPVEEPTSSDSLDNELVHTRLGLLAGYLSKLQPCITVNIHILLNVFCLDLEPVPGSAPIGEQKKDPNLKPNPYIPEESASSKQSGQCLCVPVGKCATPVPNGPPLPPPGSGPLPPPPIPGHNLPPVPPPNNNVPAVNTDGAGLIDVRIVNRVGRQRNYCINK